MAATQQKRLSMNPDTFTQGGLMSDIDVEVIDAKWTMFDYGGTSAEVPALELTLKNMEDESEETQDWSAGAAKDFEPSDDGEYIIPIGSATGFRKNSNVSHFLQSLTGCSYPKDKLDAPASSFKGLRMHVVRKPAPEREGMEERDAGNANKRKPTILVCTKIIRLPWESKGKGAVATKTTGGGKSTASDKAGDAKAASNGAGDMDEAVTTALTELLMENVGDGIAKGDVKKLILKTKAASNVKQAMMKLIADADMLGALDPAYTLNGDQIVLAD